MRMSHEQSMPKPRFRHWETNYGKSASGWSGRCGGSQPATKGFGRCQPHQAILKTGFTNRLSAQLFVDNRLQARA
jgi:hypothetical protein